MEPNGKDLVAFFDYAASKGLMNTNWAATLKGATKSVLSTVEPDGWESLNIEAMDLDALIQRFERLRMGDLKPDSLNVYGKRTRNAVTAYREFLSSPSTWQYAGGRSVEPSARPARKTSKAKPASEGQGVLHALPTASEGLITYPYPLRPGMVLSIALPPDLSQKEAERLGGFLRSVAVDEQRALPPARHEQAS